MTKNIEAYIATVRGQFIDVDGVFGAQCWDQFSHYAMWLGVPAWPTYTSAGGTTPHGGYACNVHHNALSAGLTEWFEILPANITPRKGDVAFWEFGSAWYPWSHVATVLEVTHGGRTLRCLTQNPGAVQIADLITSGIIGYLRPRVPIAGTPNANKTPPVLASAKGRSKNSMATLYVTTGNNKRPGQGGNSPTYALAGDSPGTEANWLPTVDVTLATEWARAHGNAVWLSKDTWKDYERRYKGKVSTV